MLYNTTRYYIDLDFANFKSSFIYLNEYPGNWGNKESILWSEPKQTGSMYDDAYMIFQIYDFEVCNSSLLQTVSSNWVAALDLSSTCFSVPPFLFTRLTKWLLLECPRNTQGGEDYESRYPNINGDRKTSDDPPHPYSHLCIVKTTPLPFVSFKLRQSDIHYSHTATKNDNNQHMYINLNDFIINYNDKNYLCMLNSTQNLLGKSTYVPVNDDYVSSYYSTAISSSNSPLILLGSLFLKSYGVIIDKSNSKMGFYPKFGDKDHHSMDVVGAETNCPLRKKCIGDSAYDSSLNECVPPDCSEWLLYDLDKNTNKCAINPVYPFVIAVIVVILVCFELQVMYLKQFILDRSNSIETSSRLDLY